MDGGMLVDVPWQVARFLAEKAKGAQKKSRILGAHLICRITRYFNLLSGAALSAMVDEMLDDGDEEDEAAEVRRAKDKNEGGVNFMSGPQSFPSSSTELFKTWILSNHPKHPSISSKPDRAHICTISGAIRGTATISPIRNEDLRTELEYFSEDYDEEREMEPRPEPRREATPTLQLREGNRRARNAEGIRPLEIEAREGENRGANLPPPLAAHLGRNKNSQPLRSSLTSVQRGHQPSTNMGGNLPPNGTLLSHHAQPFIPSSLHIPTGLVPTPVNPYSQPPMNLVHGQALNILFQTQTGNPPAVGTFTYQGGYIPYAFTKNSVPLYNGPMHPTVTPSSSYPFYAQPMYAPPNMPAYPNPARLFADFAGSITPFVRWIEDYPLPDGLKMPSHIGSYDGKGDPDNFLHLFEGAIRMQKWLMPVACHMFTYTLKDSARIWWNSQKTGSILNYEDLKAKFRSHFSQ
ncbi:hypothetical protein Tco_1003954 [Tanacetum coccineum]|uniref:Reverse transcriptase domain-containing protein n=1 Tax=Tanacetum coccineum TaxID=301880 RepID=A0ABQ5FAI3_9ASTR